MYNLSEAFAQLALLDEDTFKLDDEGLTSLVKFKSEDIVDDLADIIDPDALTEEDIKDSYIGDVILRCKVCDSMVYKHPEDVVIDEESQYANVTEECPYCHSVDGYEIVGQVAEWDKNGVEEEVDDVDIQETSDDVIRESYKVKRKRKLKEDIEDDDDNTLWTAIYRELAGDGTQRSVKTVDANGKKHYSPKMNNGIYNVRQVFTGPEDEIVVKAKSRDELDPAIDIARKFGGGERDKTTGEFDDSKFKFEYKVIRRKGAKDREARGEAEKELALTNGEYELHIYVDDSMQLGEARCEKRRALRRIEEKYYYIDDELSERDAFYAALKDEAPSEYEKNREKLDRVGRVRVDGVEFYISDKAKKDTQFHEAKQDYTKSCGKVIQANFKKLNSLTSKDDVVDLMSKAFAKENVPKDYAEQVITNLKRKSFESGVKYLGDIVLAGMGLKALKESYHRDPLTEATTRRGSAWVNKGKKGTHGRFKTKKAADAQRRAMFANGYKESLGSDVAKYQEWVDKDMKHGGRISDKTMRLIKRAGLSVVKDQYGEYEVIAKDADHDNHSIKESVSKRDDIDARADDRKELARKRLCRAIDDADSDRDYRLKKAKLKESTDSGLYEVGFQIDDGPTQSNLVKAASEDAAIEKLRAYKEARFKDAKVHVFGATKADSGSRKPGMPIIEKKGLKEDTGDNSYGKTYDDVLYILDQNDYDVEDGKVQEFAKIAADYIDETRAQGDRPKYTVNKWFREVSAKRPEDLKALKKINEDFTKVEVDTDDQHLKMEAEQDGKVVVTTEPIRAEDSAAVIEPVSDEVKAQIEANSEEGDTEESEDVDIEEFDEESFDELGESYLKTVYDNVKSYKTTSGKVSDTALQLEGLITFTSGKTAPTKFVFETLKKLANGKYKLLGENKHLSSKKNAFSITGDVKNKGFLTEKFTYNYNGKDAKTGKSKRLYGTIKKNK